MEENHKETPTEVKAIMKQYREYKQRITEQDAFVDELVKAVTRKEQEYHDLKADLLDQTESRRRWQKRALDVEDRIASDPTSVQYVLVLIDGNQHFFQPHFLRMGAAGADEAVKRFVAEVKDFARAQHKSDLPEGIDTVTHVFADIGQLAHDLSVAKLLPEPDTLWTFIQEVSKVDPGMTITDCGSGHGAVDTKLKYYYELFLENCHCRHVFLALGQRSEYYKVLELYGDDDYTKLKTTLIRPAHGFAENYNIPFHTIELSMLNTVQNNTEGIPPNDKTYPVRSAQWNDTSSLHAPVNTSNPTSNRADRQAPSRHDKAPLLNSTTTTTTTTPQTRPEVKATPKGSPANGTLVVNGVNGSLPEELDNESLLGVVKLDSAHPSSQTRKAAGEQSWEANITENNYTPAPIQEPWGETTNGTTNGSYDEEDTNTEDIPRSRAHTRRGERGGAGKRWPQPLLSQERRLANNSNFQRPGVQSPKQQFEGSWDDMLKEDEKRGVSQALSDQQRPGSSASSLAASAFTKKVPSTPEPNPERRPICAPIALNRFDQRIDMKLPKPSSEDQELCDLRTRNKKLCNEHHLRSACADENCLLAALVLAADVTTVSRATIVQMCHTRLRAEDTTVTLQAKACMK
ncbi:hypothetical protein H2204_006863 [Knufia peltigerae]|uniref:DUF7923 domain-containing protein n=1 Tax=Knufia peltigerae TaxID=1002370 RepID=A0AA39CYH7_9EURO|nr:hypothetical protein H2204_006863 [Knufia peltigerae]